MKVYGLSIHFFYLRARARVCVSVCAHLRDCVCVAFELRMCVCICILVLLKTSDTTLN